MFYKTFKPLKNMSFNRIQNPNKRDEEVKKYLALKETLRLKDRVEKSGEFGREEALSKIFKPVTGATAKLQESLTQQLKALPGSIAQAMPPPLPLPIMGPPPLGAEAEMEAIKDVPGKITIPGDPELTSFIVKARNNKIKSLIDIDDDGVLKINESDLIIDKKNNIKYGGETYKRTYELLNLIFSDYPDEESIRNKKAMSDYEKILLDSGVLFTETTKGTRANPKLTQTDKWKRILKPIYDKHKPTKGDGLNNNKTIILSSDPEALADRLTLLTASAQAGNTGVKNEMVEICNELIRKRVMSRKQKDLLLHDI